MQTLHKTIENCDLSTANESQMFAAIHFACHLFCEIMKPSDTENISHR